MVSANRLYGATIAIVAGSYSLWQASMGPSLTVAGWAMLFIGAVVIAHGLVLVIAEPGRLAARSGPLMMGYAVVMLGIQAVRAMDMAGGDPGMGADPSVAGADLGMVALAVLMFASGAIMVRSARRDESKPM
ncbi:MAG: hypothetical protein ABEJ57_09365 [Halobacteriaceae archaeon]